MNVSSANLTSHWIQCRYLRVTTEKYEEYFQRDIYQIFNYRNIELWLKGRGLLLQEGMALGLATF